MADKLVASLVVAALGGLTWLAYRHPKALDRLYWPIVGTAMAMFLGGLVWDGSNAAARNAIIPFVSSDKSGIAKAASDALVVLNLPLVLYLVGINFYMFFLSYLPRLIGEEKPRDKKDD